MVKSDTRAHSLEGHDGLNYISDFNNGLWILAPQFQAASLLEALHLVAYATGSSTNQLQLGSI